MAERRFAEDTKVPVDRTQAQLKAILRGVGASTVEREFYADTVMPNGQPLIEWLEPEIQRAYDTGAMPQQLLLGGPNGR